ncbi:hypothetical protein AB1Y20_002047 [Prymnesium parvum]|uniref:Uncharacterized protein n=1 Tax=Prymnesium parvum TaxID=97485 RepID=A0AB34J9V6_PRYPA
MSAIIQMGPPGQETETARKARAARFRAEARRPPPPLPVHRIAWAGGKVVTNDKEKCLQKLIQRKLATGASLTSEQERAMRTLQPTTGSSVNVSRQTNAADECALRKGSFMAKVPAQRLQTVEAVQHAPEKKQEEMREKQSSETKKLMRKLRQIEDLERARENGKSLEANQEAKIQMKPALLAELARQQRLCLASK